MCTLTIVANTMYMYIFVLGLFYRRTNTFVFLNIRTIKRQELDTGLSGYKGTYRSINLLAKLAT